jgi:hypothetical protein
MAERSFIREPVVSSFLSFLSRDMERHPESLVALSPALVERIARLTEEVDVGPHEEIVGPVAL